MPGTARRVVPTRRAAVPMVSQKRLHWTSLGPVILIPPPSANFRQIRLSGDSSMLLHYLPSVELSVGSLARPTPEDASAEDRPPCSTGNEPAGASHHSPVQSHRCSPACAPRAIRTPWDPCPPRANFSKKISRLGRHTNSWPSPDLLSVSR